MRGALGMLKRAVQSLIQELFPSVLLSRLPRSAGNAVSLTFDDGPHPVNTPRILGVLRDHGVHATFFVSGDACAEHPDLVRAIADGGHEVANHGYGHYAPDEVGTEEYLAAVDRGQELVDEFLGSPQPRVFRPPYGKLTARLFIALWRRGYRLVLWNVDSRDSYTTDPDGVIQQVFDADVGPRSIVLMHEDYDWTVDALPDLIQRIDGLGLRFTTTGLGGAVPLRARKPAPPGEERCA
ncbi:MAG: polysaccharide deacetylase family protein [Acidobacteria bacterium]|nr:polysaccharide deacetylase family protein [Acidobacteriota bacterium]